MEFGFSLPSRGQAATMQNMRLLAQHVEALGLDSVWVSDHIMERFAHDVKTGLRA